MDGWVALAIRLIQQFEGCKLDAYPDPGTGGDPWTIGWGQTGPGIRKGVRWTQAQADKALSDEVLGIGLHIDSSSSSSPMSARPLWSRSSTTWAGAT